MLRNEIPIDILIEKELMIPIRKDLEVFRFACPLCSEFNTGLLRKKNLVRCFDCNKRFNTIEIVMEFKNMGFVESVKYLKRYHKAFLGEKIGRPCEGERAIVRAADRTISREPSKSAGLLLKEIGYRPRMEGRANPVRIGEILSTILPDQSSDPHLTYTESDRIATQIDLAKKVADLEAKFDSFLNKLETIEGVINSK